ncbi:MAG TPA: hypothetical protein VG387_08765 [Rhizomicrobium sp.]|jgi:surface antigen|nr:hypothetical protein [Rhizomicrobium sp.]
MFKKSAMLAGAAMLTLVAGTSASWADDCHRDHGGGTVLGAIAGGVIGGVASHGNGLAIAGGAIFGGLAGNAISRDIDCDDRDSAYHAYQQAFDGDVGQRYEWEGRHGGHGYIVVNDKFRRDGHRCVDFTQVVWHHGDRFDKNGAACHYDGDWHIED